VSPELRVPTMRPKAQPRSGQEGMSKDIVMLHGASADSWCFGKFRDVFEG
jgi:hypothetical protein